jgi:long-chain acyl-CoA synthetase
MKKFILKELSRYRIDTYADIIYRNALLHGDKEAFICGQKRITFAGYNERVNSLIHALRSLGLSKGDGIGILTWNRLECPEVDGAAMKGGFIVSPFSPRMRTKELDYIINYSDAKVLFVGPELAEEAEKLRSHLPNVQHYISLEDPAPGMLSYRELLRSFPATEPDVDVREDDKFIIFYTSGTTGVPRGAVYTHERKLREGKTKALQVGMQPRHRHVMILPLFHIGGWSYFWSFFLVGASNVIMPSRSFDPRATFQAIREENATDIHIVPTQLVTMLAAPDEDRQDLPSLERIWYAASPMPTELLRNGIAAFGEVFAQGYGQSESGPDISILSKESHRVLDKSADEQKVLASCGQPCPGIHVRIVDDQGNDVEAGNVGEIVVQSKAVMVEYWKMPKETDNTIVDGWLHTGDMAYYDEKGFIYIVDRKKDMIITGGENVYPREVEEVLYCHQAVSEAAVIGVPDDLWVERVHAVIILKDGQKVGSDEIIAFCKEHLAGYKTPRSVEFVESLPTNPSGKILKRELRSKYTQDGEMQNTPVTME